MPDDPLIPDVPDDPDEPDVPLDPEHIPLFTIITPGSIVTTVPYTAQRVTV